MEDLTTAQTKVLGIIADRETQTWESVTGRRIRTALGEFPSERVNEVLAGLSPRYVEVSGESRDTYSLTIEGWIHTKHGGTVSRLVELLLGLFRKKLTDDPDFQRFTWEEVREATALGDDAYYLAYHVIIEGRLWSGGGATGASGTTGPSFSFEPPRDIEKLTKLDGIGAFLDYCHSHTASANSNASPVAGDAQSPEWDVFICHASEDKASFVKELAEALRSHGLRVWYDEFTLKLGDGLRRSIDRGLASSRYGIVVLSKAFFSKQWPQRELDGLVQKEVGQGEKVILPIWHGVARDDVAKFSLTLADKRAVSTSVGMAEVVREILDVLHPAGPQAPPPPPSSTVMYTKKVRANFQGQVLLRKGHEVELSSWLGPGGAQGGGTLRVLEMIDLTDDVSYQSDIAHVMMTVQPTKVRLRARIAGDIAHQQGSWTFALELTEEEYAKFLPHVEPELSAFVR